MNSTSDWRSVISEQDVTVYEEAGFGRSGKPGTRPAILVIDMQYRTLGEPRMPILDAIRQSYKTACGEVGWAAVDAIAPVLRAARGHGVPVIVPHVAPKRQETLGRLADKVPSIVSVDERGYEFPEELDIQSSDLRVPKDHPSAFFGTNLTSLLIDKGVDTLIIAGCTTSGCVRATAVDAFSLNFKLLVVEDAVYDRGEVSHKVNLFDLSQKYADVWPSDRVLDYVTSVGAR